MALLITSRAIFLLARSLKEIKMKHSTKKGMSSKTGSLKIHGGFKGDAMASKGPKKK